MDVCLLISGAQAASHPRRPVHGGASAAAGHRLSQKWHATVNLSDTRTHKVRYIHIKRRAEEARSYNRVEFCFAETSWRQWSSTGTRKTCCSTCFTQMWEMCYNLPPLLNCKFVTSKATCPTFDCWRFVILVNECVSFLKILLMTCMTWRLLLLRGSARTTSDAIFLSKLKKLNLSLFLLFVMQIAPFICFQKCLGGLSFVSCRAALDTRDGFN